MSQIPAKVESLDLNRETIVICHHGIRSRSVGRYLEQNGFDNIINLSGGVDQWAKTVDNKMTTY
jgi:rhodanese-related sulfurtransferase